MTNTSNALNQSKTSSVESRRWLLHLFLLLMPIVVVLLAANSIASAQAGPTSEWNEIQQLFTSTGQANDGFGRVVAIDGDTMVSGSSGDDDLGNFSGSATVFQQTTATGLWQESQPLLASNGTSLDFFGHSVAIAGDFNAKCS